MFTKSNCIIIFAIGLILIIIYSIANSTKSIEGFNPYLDFTRAYPSTFALNRDYGPYNKSFYMYPDGYYQPYNRSAYPGNFRYNPGYGDYWYIPKHEYLKNWMGAPESRDTPISYLIDQTYPNNNTALPNLVGRALTEDLIFPTQSNCIVPASISEYCVNSHIQENGNLDMAIGACTVPPSISEACKSQNN